MTKEIKPTIESKFEQFKQRCLFYQKRFELSHWKIIITLIPLGKICLSRTKADPFSLVGEIEFNREVPLEILTDDEIARGARHEMLHILTRKLRLLADKRFASEYEIAQAEEELTKRLEEILKPL